MPRAVLVLPFLIAPFLTACAAAEARFSVENASAHVGMLAGTIGSRPVGTPANARARDYIIDQLRLFGFDVRVQETDARRAEFGLTARVANIIAVRPGTREEAIGLLSHYDSSPDAPGAADDGLGVAVSLEAARVLGARTDPTWSLMVLVTDGEEAGLMGAAALTTDREVMRRLQAYLNIEAVGSDGPSMLFETGPGNGWLVSPWARHAPNPRGGSFGIEVYKRLPNDTDFSIFKHHGIPGLNFAAVGDSYGYHTARDTPDRVSSSVLRSTGENVVAIVSAADGADITRREGSEPTYFDLAGVRGMTYGRTAGWALAFLAILAGVLAWLKVTAAAIRMGGVWRWLLTVVWTVVGFALVVAAMIGATWALRAAREVYHPWYAHPGRLFVLLVVIGIAVGWSASRVGYWLPKRTHGMRDPLVTWSVALPIWIVLAAIGMWSAPGAAYLWVLPLLVAGVLLALVPAAGGLSVRIASAAILAVAAIFWLRDIVELLRFAVAIFGRLPMITPVFVYAVALAAAGVMLAPPFIAMTATSRPLLRPTLVTSVLMTVVAVAAAVAWVAPAYTFEQPMRRVVRALQGQPDGPAIWEIGSVEPGLDLGPGAPDGWTPASASAPATGSRPLPQPFVFRTTGPTLGPPPVAIAGFAIEPLPDGVEVLLTVIPKQPGLTFAFRLPEGVTPARSNLPGRIRQGRWTAVYVAPPDEGMVFRASIAKGDPARLQDTDIVVSTSRIPGGEGWQQLPAWLPQERSVWSATASWIVPATTTPPIPLVPPLK